MILVIDTATASCSVALIEGGKLIDSREALVGRGHAERLLPMIADLLGGRRPDSILVDCGPGSFTGIRVGLAAAQGLAIGWDLPVAGCSSMALIAAAAGAHELAVALEGGHGEIFVQGFADDPIAPTDDLRSLKPEADAAVISAELVAGSGAERLVSARGHGRALPALPRAADARLLPPALRALPVRPIYGRAPDAKPVQGDAAGGVEGPLA